MMPATDAPGRRSLNPAWLALLLLLTAPALAAELPQQPGEYELITHHAGRERGYILHLPSQYDGKRKLPLLLAFHGGGGNARQLLNSNSLANLADRKGFVLVAPYGSGKFKKRFLTWNVGFGFGYAMEHRVDDIGFVRQLLDELETELRIDPGRIYATGISNGGILCHFLAAHLSGRITAIAPIVAAVGGRRSADEPMIMPPVPASPVAVIAFNGMRDERIPYTGGRQIRSVGDPVYVAPAETMHAFWTKANHCSESPKVEEHTVDRYRVLTFAKGCAGHEVVQYQLLDQGHAWPGGKRPRFFADKPSPDVSADEAMWEFFRTRSK